MPPALPSLSPPDGIGREYYAEIRRLLETERRATWRVWVQELRPLIHLHREESAPVTANRATMRANDALWDISRILRRMHLDTERRMSQSVLEQIAGKFVRRVVQVTGANWRRQVQRVLGIDPASNDAWLAGMIETAVQENVSWIKSVATEYLSKVETVVVQGARRGESLNDMAAAIAEAGDVSVKRAKFIARDQLGSLYGDMTKARQTRAGMTRFRWRTSDDERVRGRPGGRYPDARPSHWELEGQVFTWAEGAVVDGRRLWPGTDYNCRCTAEPIIEELLEVVADADAAD